MALTNAGMVVSRVVRCGLSSKFLQPSISAPTLTQVATLVSTHGQPLPREAPFDYKKRKYWLWHQLTDVTSRRLDENSKIIVVDGNLATGKKDFAQKLAKEFDMKYYPPINEEDIFRSENGMDLRVLDQYLPEQAKCYDLENFYTDTNPQRGAIGVTQLWIYRLRFFQYAEAITHMLNTGQGAVLVRSPYSDAAFVEAMRKMKYITASAKRFYETVAKYTICELLPPHLTVYLDSPVTDVRKAVTQRGVPCEQNSSVLSDAYLKAIENAHKNVYLPQMKETGEVLEVDCTDIDFRNEHDWELVVEDLEQLELTGDEFSEKPQFYQWTNLTEDMLCYYRAVFTNKDYMNSLFRIPVAEDIPELLLTDDTLGTYRQIVENHPLFAYDLKYSPEKYSSWQLAMKL